MTTDKSPVTVLGLGPMGSALARAFLDHGHPTTVWNRTAARADPLVARGARRAATVADAAGPLVVVSLIDYAATDAVLEPALTDLKHSTVVNLTADTPQRARAMATAMAAHGIDYLDGSIMTPVETIGGAEALVLYSGPAGTYQRHRDTLTSIGGTGTYLGVDPGRAAAFDVSLLDLFWTTMSGYVHALALARSQGITGPDLAPYARGIVGLMPGIIDEFAGHADRREYPGEDATLASAAAGMDHVIQASEAAGLDTGALTAARAVAQRAIDDGHGAGGFSRLIETFAQRAGGVR
jgi:3-hydroxyisobutyrate dehydrogenase-like beta-hydroxyacid dehydrogenase